MLNITNHQGNVNYLTPVRMATNKLTNNTDVEKRETLCILVGLYIGVAPMENIMEVPQNIKNRPHNSTSGYLFKEITNTSLKRYTHPYVHYSITCNRQDMAV